MNFIAIALILNAFLAGASYATYDSQWFQKYVTDRYSPQVQSALLPEASVKARDTFKSEPDQLWYIYEYFRGYLHGLENTHGTMSVGDAGSPGQVGFDAGLWHFQDLLSTTNQPFTLVDFGYEPMTAAGTYVCEFENSSFRPDGNNEDWWVDFQIGVIEAFLEKHPNEHPNLFDNRRSCTFNGFLSPDQVGFTGHMNQFDRDFIIMEILEVGPEPSTENLNVEIE